VDEAEKIYQQLREQFNSSPPYSLTFGEPGVAINAQLVFGSYYKMKLAARPIGLGRYRYARGVSPFPIVRSYLDKVEEAIPGLKIPTYEVTSVPYAILWEVLDTVTIKPYAATAEARCTFSDIENALNEVQGDYRFDAVIIEEIPAAEVVPGKPGWLEQLFEKLSPFKEEKIDLWKAFLVVAGCVLIFALLKTPGKIYLPEIKKGEK